MLFTEAYAMAQDSTMCLYRPKHKRVIVTNACSLPPNVQKEMLGDVTDNLRLASMMLTEDNGVLSPYFPTYEDFIATDWQVSYYEAPEKKPMHVGIVKLSDSLVDTAIDFMESWGYGRHISSQQDKEADKVLVTFESSLFDKLVSGEPTPFYVLEADEHNQTMRAARLTD